MTINADEISPEVIAKSSSRPVASGAGAAGRYSMGLVISTGLSIGTLFTLFVVPAVYMLLAKDRSESQAEEQSQLLMAKAT